MTPDECNIVYRHLEEALTELGLTWIIAQVRYKIRIGRIAEERTPRRKRKNVIESIDYSPKESLLILLDAIEKASSDLIELESETLNFFSMESERLRIGRGIQFFSDDFEDVEVVVLNSSFIQGRTEGLRRLKKMIAVLKQSCKED